MNPLKSPRSFNLSRSVVVLVAALTALATPIFANARTMDHAAQAGGKKIVISLAAGRVCAYQGGTAIFCTGANMRGTRRGTFYIQNKLPVAKSFAWACACRIGWASIMGAGCKTGSTVSPIPVGVAARALRSVVSSCPLPLPFGSTAGPASAHRSLFAKNPPRDLA